jgi:DNA adenine methylase
MSTSVLKAPFPYFGGKSKVAPLIWDRFGDVANYVEPFAGSLAVLLGRPTPPGTETVNDVDHLLTNAWRAIQADPDAVAHWASWPVSECDLHARHLWLVNRAEVRERMMTEPDYFDAKVAGWWIWGACAWIGSGWCRNAGRGINRQLPHVGDAGRGINRQLPHVGDAGRGIHAYLCQLSDRLRKVRVCCGNWTRVLTPSVTTRHGLTAVLLDPPYVTEGRVGGLYTNDDGELAIKAQEWAIENGDDPLLRIAYCGYEDQRTVFPPTWECMPWKAVGGYNSDQSDEANCRRERVWYSPHCLRPESERFPLFAGLAEGGER